MPRTVRFSTLLCLVLILPACQRETPAPQTQETVGGLEYGWNLIEPGGETTCSNGTPYAFYVRPGDPRKLLIYFQGGGACWFGETCDLTMTPTYDPTVTEDDDPTGWPGIFEYDHPENPFADYSTVFVPYCTADVHLGDAVTTYPVPATDSTEAHDVTINHRGHVNTRAVLDWTFAYFSAPSTVFVTGSSAGAFPSAFYLPYVAEEYPEAHIAHLADGAGGYRGMDYLTLNDRWGIAGALPPFPEFEALAPANMRLEGYLIASARRYPDIVLTEYNTAGDDVQRRFLRLGGITGTPLQTLLEANYTDVRNAVSNFRTYTAPGTSHTLLGRPEFYTVQVDGLRFRDWIAALALGDPVNDVTCLLCDTDAENPDAVPSD